MTHPANWKQRHLSDLLSGTFDGAWGDEASPGTGVPVIRSTDMRGGRLSFDEVAHRLVPEKTVAKKALQTGDILVNKSSGSSHLVGAVVPFTAPTVNDQSYLCLNFIRCLRPNTAHIEPMFLYFYLLSPYFRDQVFHASRTTSGLRNLNMTEYLGAQVSFPETTEQRRLVAKILEMMGMVEEIVAMRNSVEGERASLLPSLIESQLNIEWPMRSLEQLTTDIRNGWSGKPDDRAREVGMLRLSCVHGMTIDLNDTKPIRIDEETTKLFSVRCNDVFIVRGNGSRHLVGRSAIAIDSHATVVFNDLLIRLAFTDEVVPQFANYVLHSYKVREQIERVSKTAAGIWKINQAGVRSIRIPCPARSEQHAFVEVIHTMQAASEELGASIANSPVEKLQSAILGKAFAGEL